MHTPCALQFEDESLVFKDGREGRKPASKGSHMPSALQFDDMGAQHPASQGCGARVPTALELEDRAPRPSAASLEPEALSLQGTAPKRGPEPGESFVEPGLSQQVSTLAQPRNLGPQEVGSALRQAQSLLRATSETIDSWAAQALQQHAELVAKSSVLRDRINQASLAEVLARASAADPAPVASPTRGGLAGAISGLIHAQIAPAQAKLDLDAQAGAAHQAAELAKAFSVQLDEVLPLIRASCSRLGVALTAVEAACGVLDGRPSPNASSTLDPRRDRLGVRQDILARAFIQAGLLVQTMAALRENTQAWSDQAEYIQTVLIPARRLAR